MASFNIYKPTLFQLEGGYQNYSSWSENYNSLNILVGSNHGITAFTYESWLGLPPTESDMRNMSQNGASEIYKEWYWNEMKANYIYNQATAELIVDHGINAGTYGATKILQRTLNNRFNKNLLVDGNLGNKTLTAINSVNANDLFIEFAKSRKAYYLKLNKPTFLDTWLNRIEIIANKYSINIAVLSSNSSNGILVISILGIMGWLAYDTIKNRKQSYV